MGNVIISLGIVAYSIMALTIIFLVVLRIKKIKAFYRLHRAFGIAGISMATVHGLMAALYFWGII